VPVLDETVGLPGLTEPAAGKRTPHTIADADHPVPTAPPLPGNISDMTPTNTAGVHWCWVI